MTCVTINNSNQLIPMVCCIVTSWMGQDSRMHAHNSHPLHQGVNSDLSSCLKNGECVQSGVGDKSGEFLWVGEASVERVKETPGSSSLNDLLPTDFKRLLLRVWVCVYHPSRTNTVGCFQVWLSVYVPELLWCLEFPPPRPPKKKHCTGNMGRWWKNITCILLQH